MIKLQDFAREQGVTDRQIQRLIKKYETELEGHYDRRGPNGTWLDDEACYILRGKMKSKEIVLYDTESTDRIKELEAKIERLEDRLEKKEQYIAVMEVAAANKQAKIETLESEKLQIEENTSKRIKTAEDELHLEKQRADQLEKQLEDRKNWGLLRRIKNK